MSLAVVDEGGTLIAFLRMDGARFFSGRATIKKAITSASQRLPSGYFPKDGEVSMMIRMDGDFTNVPGGLPITVGGPGGGRRRRGRRQGRAGCRGRQGHARGAGSVDAGRRRLARSALSPPGARPCATLHLWTQIVGKVRLALTPWLNHCWQVPLYVTARGLTTSPIPIGERRFEIEFDFVEHALRCADERGERADAGARAADGGAISIAR